MYGASKKITQLYGYIMRRIVDGLIYLFDNNNKIFRLTTVNAHRLVKIVDNNNICNRFTLVSVYN